MNSKNQSQYSNMSQQTAEQSAVKTLEHLGYTYHGGTQWKPPLGKSSSPLLDRITELEAQLQQHQWQPIETAPKDGTTIIVGRPDMPTNNPNAVHEGCVGTAYYIDGEWVTPADGVIDVFGNYVTYVDITSYKPLPPKPTIQAEGKA